MGLTRAIGQVLIDVIGVSAVSRHDQAWVDLVEGTDCDCSDADEELCGGFGLGRAKVRCLGFGEENVFSVVEVKEELAARDLQVVVSALHESDQRRNQRLFVAINLIVENLVAVGLLLKVELDSSSNCFGQAETTERLKIISDT